MRMAFGKAGIGNPDKFAVFPQIVHSLCTAVSHAAAKTADHLENGVCKCSLVRNTAFHAFRNKFLCTFLTSLVDFHCAGRFLRTGQQAAEHDAAAACGNCLCNISGIFDSAVRNNTDTVFVGLFGTVGNRGNLGNADTGNNPRGTDGSRTDADLNVVKERHFDKDWPMKKALWRNLLNNCWLGSCMAFTREVKEACLPFPPKAVAHDLWISYYSQVHFRCGYQDEVLQLYRRHEGTVSFTGGKSKNSLYYRISYRLYLAWHLFCSIFCKR